MESIDIKYVNSWTGYKNYRDITNLAVTDITAGSQNVFVEDGAKISVRGGSRFLGAEGTVGVQTNDYWAIAHRIHSNYDKFVNGGGFTLPIRIYYSGTTAVADVFQVYLPTYVAGVAQETKQWYTASQFITPANPLLSNHRWYFAEWWDGVAKVPNLIFCAGTNKIRSWTGGYAPITAVGGTTLTTNATWASLGFINAAAGGSDTIIVNGVAYVTNGNFSTNTVTIPLGTAGVSVNNLAFADIVTYTSPDNVIFDVCSMVNNQVYYIDWRQRNVLVSWDRNQNASLELTIYQGTSGLNDAVFSGTYTAGITGDYEVTIDSTSPSIDQQTFAPGGEGSLDDAVYDTSGFSDLDGNTHVYTTTVLADFTIAIPSATAALGSGVVISGAAGAQGILVARETFGGGNDVLAIKMLTTDTNFSSGEVITSNGNGVTATLTGAFSASWIQFSKDGVVIPIDTGSGLGTEPVNSVVSGTAIPLTDGLTITFSTPRGHSVGDTFILTIRSAEPDTFTWSYNGVTQAANVAITGARKFYQTVFQLHLS